DERPLAQRELPTGAQVEDRVLGADAAAEAAAVRPAERRVVGEAGRVPVAPRVRVAPAQVVLAAAPGVLLDPLIRARLDERVALAAGLPPVAGRAPAPGGAPLLAPPAGAGPAPAAPP